MFESSGALAEQFSLLKLETKSMPLGRLPRAFPLEAVRALPRTQSDVLLLRVFPLRRHTRSPSSSPAPARVPPQGGKRAVPAHVSNTQSLRARHFHRRLCSLMSRSTSKIYSRSLLGAPYC
jgi:hypothetical protein